jgi:GTP-binding protein
VDELIEQILRLLEASGPPVRVEEGERPLNVAIVGRPNVGKSSLMNRLAGEERAVVSEVPGTTRDSIDVLLELALGRYRLIDTAGIRRPGRVRQVVERFSVSRARRNIERCDVAVLVLDASEEFAAQDAHIAGYVTQAFKPMVVVVNKWDLIEGREEQAKVWEERVRHRLRFAKEVPLVLISAKTGQRVTRVLDHVDTLFAAAGKTVPTAELNRWLQGAGGAHARGQSQSLRLYYTTQIGVHPPTFVLFCNDRRALHFSMQRYLVNGLRETFGFGGAPLRLRFRERREAAR